MPPGTQRATGQERARQGEGGEHTVNNGEGPVSINGNPPCSKRFLALTVMAAWPRLRCENARVSPTLSVRRSAGTVPFPWSLSFLICKQDGERGRGHYSIFIFNCPVAWDAGLVWCGFTLEAPFAKMGYGDARASPHQDGGAWSWGKGPLSLLVRSWEWRTGCVGACFVKEAGPRGTSS
jgi:hypothetical protein